MTTFLLLIVIIELGICCAYLRDIARVVWSKQ
jgi:hypothetical protein